MRRSDSPASPEKSRSTSPIPPKGADTLAHSDLISESETTVSAELAPGSYTFYCSVPGHREAGMEGILSVK
jgi:azurin